MRAISQISYLAEQLVWHKCLNIKGPIRRANISNGNENNINQGPNPKSSKAEQLSNAFLPVTQVEPVRPKASKSDREDEGGSPTVAFCPVTLNSLAEHLLPQTYGVRA